MVWKMIIFFKENRCGGSQRETGVGAGGGGGGQSGGKWETSIIGSTIKKISTLF